MRLASLFHSFSRFMCVVEEWNTATIEDLLRQQSGLVYETPIGHEWHPIATIDAAVASLNETKLVFPPRKGRQWSAANYLVLAKVIEGITGTTFHQVFTGLKPVQSY